MKTELFQEVSQFLKLNKQKKDALARLGIFKVKDLLLHKPNYYKDRKLFPSLNRLSHGTDIVASVVIEDINYPAKRSLPTKILASNETGSIILVYFNMPPYMRNIFKKGARLTISGKVEFFDYRAQISHPEIIFNSLHITASEPIYALTYGLSNNVLWSYITKAIQQISSNMEWLPNELLESYELPSFLDAVATIHSLSKKNILIDKAYLRLKIDEIYANQISFVQVRKFRHTKDGRKFTIAKQWQEKVLSNFGYPLTNGQLNATKDIQEDQVSDVQMLRMLQGDVGCGKTLVAILTLLNAAYSGCQVAVMVPTDILAQQHFTTINKLTFGLPLKTVLLTGKVISKKRIETYNQIESGDANIIIGTHALFQEKIKFKDLGYIIVDEQHRFGVKQRLDLIAKGNSPDMLIMSATPIPRTLTIALFGDMPATKIEEMPIGRHPIKTSICSSKKIDELVASLRNVIDKGDRIYWICPLIEGGGEDNNDDSKVIYANVEERYASLKSFFGDKVGLLHGKMSAEQKDGVMAAFKSGEHMILVATTVVEVGVDVPEATTIVIENAEKFGLAQMHQLRGRVGRGVKESFCILVYGIALSQTARQRLEIMKESNNGFYIAEQDLKLRGGGEILGTKQSGEQNFKFANLADDSDYILKINKYAENSILNEESDILLRIFDRYYENSEILS